MIVLRSVSKVSKPRRLPPQCLLLNLFVRRLAVGNGFTKALHSNRFRRYRHSAVTRSHYDVLDVLSLRKFDTQTPTLEQQTPWRLPAAKEHRRQHVGCDATAAAAWRAGAVASYETFLPARRAPRTMRTAVHACGRAYSTCCAPPPPVRLDRPHLSVYGLSQRG